MRLSWNSYELSKFVVGQRNKELVHEKLVYSGQRAIKTAEKVHDSYLNCSIFCFSDGHRYMPGLPLLSKSVALRFAKTGWNELHRPVHYEQHLRWSQVINNFTLGRILVN